MDPTVVMDGAQNPFFAIRGGGGVNQSTRFAPVEGLTNVWEYTFPLTNDRNECAKEFLTEEYNLRVIVVDETETVTLFQDFSPLE